MTHEKRMHRLKNISIMDPPVNIANWYNNKKYSNDRITVFRLHDMIDINETEKKAFCNDLLKKLNQKERIESEKLAKTIINESNISVLISIFESDKHKELVQEIIQRMVVLDGDIFNRYLDKLKGQYTENEFDNIVSILVETIKNKDISKEILAVLKNDIVRDPQDFAVLIQVLGLGNDYLLPYLYTFYHYFINNFPDDNYFEGPLLGISCYIERRRRTIAST